ncbi:MAG TPA: hypothetical protein ENN91_06530 [Firmicutes bacterium]|nr:hypothetical protein [Bacillota bacterium]
MAKNRVRAKDIKKQRWAGIIAAVLALAMIASLAGVYLAQRAGRRSEPVPEQQAELQPEDYVAHYQGEVERLEQYLEEHDPTEAVLLELGENYRYLVFIQEIFFDDAEAVEEYRDRLISVYDQLTEMNPDNLFYRLELAYLLIDSGDEEMVDREIETIRQMLRKDTDARIHLSLIGLLSSTEREQVLEEEIEWLQAYLEGEISAGRADNEGLFYYAVLKGEYLNQESEAEAVLKDILDQESEESSLYMEAANYLEHLTGSDSAEDTSTD